LLRPTRVTISAAQEFGPAISPDGKWLPKNVGFGNAFLAWEPDGRRVAAVRMAANANAQIWIVDPESSAPFQKLVELPPSVRVRGITWAPDGSTVVFAKQEPRTDIVLYDVQR
jgi:Tol biopolymer transport system component